jgi:cation transport protein ChaC
MMARLSLTAEHVAHVHRAVEDEGIAPGGQLNTDADYAEWVARIIASHPAPHEPTRLFAYGSLIWKPEIDHVGEQLATARGWHRAFCFRMTRFRGTHAQPGLMMALDRGGQCRGVAFELPQSDLGDQLGRLFRREFTYKPVNSMPRWINVTTAQGACPALAFVMNRASPLYAGRLSPEEVADVLARSCGHWGTGAEYLLNTVSHLEEKGIRDSNLWRLQKLVAQRIEADISSGQPSRR